MVGELKEMCGGRGPDVCIDAVGMEAEGSLPQRLLGVRMKMLRVHQG